MLRVLHLCWVWSKKQASACPHQVATYESALGLAQEGHSEEAVTALQQLLREPLLVCGEGALKVNSTRCMEPPYAACPPLLSSPSPSPPTLPATSSNLLQLRHLSLKNLAGLLGPDSPTALRLYCQAAAEDGDADDAVLWHRLADAALRQGQAGLGRYALEQGLRVCPRHTVLAEKLMEVCVGGGGAGRSHRDERHPNPSQRDSWTHES